MRKELIERNPILKLSFDFSLLVINYCELLDVQKKYIFQNNFSGPEHQSGRMPWKHKMQKAKQTLFIK